MKKKKRKLLKLIFIIILLMIIVKYISVIQMDYSYKTDYSQIIKKYASMYEIDENLIYAVIKNESSFNPNAVSKVGAKGLMQIMDSTADDVAKELELTEYDLFSPEDNIKIGVKYLADLVNKYGEKSLAVAAYNAGYGTVDLWISDGIIKSDGTDYENIPYKETNMYVRKVLRDYSIYNERI